MRLLMVIWIFALFMCACKANTQFAGGAAPIRTAIPQKFGAAPATPVVTIIPQIMPENAVQQGSFTAWTIPANPSEGETYTIVILVKLPALTQAYNRADLTGIVTGSDGYTQSLTQSTAAEQESFIVEPAHAKLEIQVPGAQSLVHDKIQIKSKVLNEAQVLELIFK